MSERPTFPGVSLQGAASELSERTGESPPADCDGRILSVHMGSSANCSSVGSYVDFLFLSSVAGASLLSAIAALIRRQASGTEDLDAQAKSPEQE